ncbi:attachment protein [Litorimonas cladophorae]|uniref:Attachment protein n=1 Tax=Litorimonas cladophorae TaxID=1220491 RepID=A0A918KJH0_9PROT|nr:host attachment family protein [Litorimonas cladophorae]GGX65484.1 attachment protein [Litorimonas cladophorae]
MTDLTLPQNTLVILATGEEAKLFRFNGNRLKKTEDWFPQDLASEGPSGKSPPERSPQESMEATFSKQIAERLYSMAHAGKFNDLVLTADPETLGEIRPLLHKEVQDKILAEIDKTLINSPTDDVEKSIAAHMAAH